MGLKLGQEDLQIKAANIRDLSQRFNRREGLTKKDDTLPQRFFQQSIGGEKVIQPEELDQMLTEYYGLRGWDAQGNPPDAEYL